MWRKTFMITSLCVAAIATFSAWALADPTRGPVKGAVGYSGGAVAAPVMLPDGSVSAPALTFMADTDIGIYRIGADIIGIAVNGALNATFDVVGLDLVGNLELTGGGSVITTSDGDIVLAPNGSGVVDVQNAAVYVGDGTYSWDHSPTGFATEGSIEVDGLCSLDGGANFYDTNILNPSVLYQEAAASDIAADHIATEAGNAFYKATVNIDGADNVKCGGIGVKSMAVVQVGSAGSTITITTTDAVGTYTSTTLTLVSGAPGAGEIQCITSDAVCAAAIVAHLASNVTHVTAEAVTAQVYLIPAATLCAMGLASADGGGTRFVLTNGADGVVRIPFTERLALDGDLDTYIASTSDDTIGFYTSGILQFQMTTTNFHILDNYITGTAGTRINFPADNQTRFCNALQTQCFVLAATAADTVTLFDGAGTGAGSLVVGGALTVQAASDSAITTAGGIVLGATRWVNWTGKGYFGQPTDGEFLFRNNSGSSNIYISSDYGALYGVAPTTDVVADNISVIAPNAWAQATAGQQDGASNSVAAGIRTLRHICSDRTLTDTDTAAFVVDGVDTVLTESTDFDCHGTGSEEICCDNFGAAVTTNVATIKMVPDCDTTAGTCYLTPLEDVLWVEDIFYTDGGVNNVGWTLTEGTDGDIGLYADNILTKIWDVDYVVRAGTTSFPPAAPAWGVNDSCAGLAFDADAEYANISFEIPSCWAGRARDDLVLRVYWCPEDAQDPANTEVVKWDISYRVLDWGTDDVDTDAAVINSVAYTQSGAGDEGDTFIHEITIDADDTDQPLVAGEVLAIHFDRDWSDGANYPHDAIVALWEIQVPQTSLKCDHHN